MSQDGFKWNGTHQLLVYDDDVNILRGSVCTIKKNTSFSNYYKETGLEVNAYKLSTCSCLEIRMQGEVTI